MTEISMAIGILYAGFIVSRLNVVRKSKPIKLKNRMQAASTIPEIPLSSFMKGSKLSKLNIETDANTMIHSNMSLSEVTILLKRPAPFAPVV